MVVRVTSCTSDVAPIARSSWLTKHPAKLGTAYRNWPCQYGRATSRAQHPYAVLDGNGVRQRHGDALGVPHKRVPLAPKGPHLQLVIHERLGALHAARHVRPLDLAVGKTLLAGFEGFHVIRRGKSAWPKKR